MAAGLIKRNNFWDKKILFNPSSINAVRPSCVELVNCTLVSVGQAGQVLISEIIGIISSTPFDTHFADVHPIYFANATTERPKTANVNKILGHHEARLKRCNENRWSAQFDRGEAAATTASRSRRLGFEARAPLSLFRRRLQKLSYTWGLLILI